MLTLGSLKSYCQQADSIGKVNPYQPKIQSFIIPAAFLTYGIIALNENPFNTLDRDTRAELQEDHPRFAAHVDNYSQFAPAAAVFILNFSGIKGKNSIKDAAFIYAISTAIMGGTVSTLKSGIHRLRPDASAFNSFPSGHTATAFAAAEFLKQEYKDLSPWYNYAGYTVAIATGTLRMYNNKHWFSDVVAGAGIGIISTKLSYLVYPELKKLFKPSKRSNVVLMPTYNNKLFGLAYSARF
ncbi:PAP2 superfamily protein [Pedobacter psychrotolerans]|uniref:PAP2 superfamily protein n=1 Tax=Pedobacter psychrotolerans TaxID=1843235 RepID=A0A4R2H9S8_9SPHI|nr:phosphatase PAP2 family protein [Pedobacter psychrotolerans]TCO23849.1 PAP2 superfamily protein [Pedobacter psychrotolerans]GGE63050.1 phospholipid phosphatase [Pedobacter psychrotolerans]